MKLRATHLVLPAYVLVALAYTWPLVLHLGHAIPVTGLVVDARFQAFLLGWDWRALATHRPVFDVPIFHPERNTLTYMDHLLGEAFLGAPVYALTRSVATAYDCVVLSTFVLGAWAAYRLARACGASRPAAWLAGFLYAFSPYHFSNIDQLNLLQVEVLPLALWFALRCLARGRWRDWAGLAACLLAQVYLGWYYTFFLALALAVLLAWALVQERAALRRVAWARAAIALALFAALALPVTLPYAAERRALPEFQRTVGEVDAQSPSPAAFVRVNRRARATRWMPSTPIDKGYWPGVVTLVLAVVAWRSRPRARLSGLFAVLAVSSAVFALGPHLIGSQHRILPVPLPWLVLYKFVPGFASIRATGRLAVVTLLALVVLAALGYDAVRRELAARRGARWARAFGVLAFLVAGAEALQEPLLMAELPTAATVPPVYTWLAAQPGAPPVLELPAPVQAMNERERDVLRQYDALVHGKPRLDGASGFVSNRYRNFRVALRDFPTPATLDTARALGAEIVIVHLGDYAPADRAARQAALARIARLAPVASFGDDVAYRWMGAHTR